jgi:Rod binding domain-containing protein
MNIPNSLMASVPESTLHAAASPQLVKAANAFEANFLGELLKPLREDPLFGNGSGLGGDSLGSDGPSSGSMGTVGSLASDALAQAIARQGGLGMAKMVLAQLGPVEQTASQAAAALAGPKCGGCSPALTMTPEVATSTDAGSVAMLGEGTLSSAAVHQPTKNSMDKLARKGNSLEGRDGSISVEILRPLSAVKK